MQNLNQWLSILNSWDIPPELGIDENTFFNDSNDRRSFIQGAYCAIEKIESGSVTPSPASLSPGAREKELRDAFIHGALAGKDYELPTGKGQSFGEYVSEKFKDFLRFKGLKK